MSPRSASRAPMTFVQVDARSRIPLHRQIYDGLRDAIVAGRLAPGSRLPPERVIAADLSVSRVTVVSAVSQLRAEGYVESRERSGVFVSASLPEDLLATRSATRARGSSVARGRPGGKAPAAEHGDQPRPFQSGLPAVDAFPWTTWSRLMSRRLKRSARALAGYGDSRGFAPLRAAVADYVGAARSVACTPEQVFITSGAQQALNLVATVLVAPGDEVCMEDPGYPGARLAFSACGSRLTHIRVDDEGLSVAQARRRTPSARAIYVTPSHQ
jgi:GntR family transcriptional regulator/MocR family aminotransferase